MAIDVESAVMRLYEDTSLRDAISDDPANTLLKWAEDKVIALAEKHDDDEAFEDEFKTLRRLIKTMNRYGGRQGAMDGEEKQKYMGKLVERAQSLGLPVKQPKADDMIQAQGVLSEEDGINALIDMLAPSSDEHKQADSIKKASTVAGGLVAGLKKASSTADGLVAGLKKASSTADGLDPTQEPPLEEDEETVPIDPYKLGLNPLKPRPDDTLDTPDGLS